MKLVPILVVIASLMAAAAVYVVPVSVDASTANTINRLTITDTTTEESTKSSNPNSGIAAVERHNTFTQDFRERNDPALTLDLNLETPGGPTITQETQSASSSGNGAGLEEVSISHEIIIRQ